MFDSKSLKNGHIFNAMPKRDPAGRDSEMARRLRQLRFAFDGDNASAFARRIGVSVPRWSNVENGVHLGIDLANILLRKVPGLSLDWLYHGKREGLSYGILRMLDEAEAAESADSKSSKTA